VNEPAGRIAFAGAVNFRDIGGYDAGPGRRLRAGRVFRSDNLSGLTEADLERFDALGIRTVVDFRVPFERHHKPNRLPSGRTIRVVELGFVPAGGIAMLQGIAAGTLGADDVIAQVVAQYRSFVLENQEIYRRALACVLEPDALPVLMHCTSGKDRTGFAIAVLLAALGTSRDTIVRDFVYSNEYRHDISNLFTPSTQPGVRDVLSSVRPGYIEAAFAQIDETYGSIDAYLSTALGIDDAMRSRLVETLTEPIEPGSA
jgi:protein-tyrosine phosphatase